MKYGTPSDNPLTRDIKQMYSFVFKATRRAIAEVGNNFMRDIPDTEIAYLCIYMVSNPDEKKVHQSAKYDGSILIVGPKNMAIATLIKEQIQDLLGDSFEYDVISLSRLKTRMLSEYVMVVLVDVPRGKVTGENVVETSIVLNKEDQQKIVDILQNEKLLSKYNNKIEDILSIVEENVTQPIERKSSISVYFVILTHEKGIIHQNGRGWNVFWARRPGRKYCRIIWIGKIRCVMAVSCWIVRKADCGNEFRIWYPETSCRPIALRRMQSSFITRCRVSSREKSSFSK